MHILGLNAYHGDSSAAVIKDGNLIAAAEEERFRRIKHWAGFPREAICYCLDEAAIKPGELDYIAVNRNPRANLLKKAIFVLTSRPDFGLIKSRLANAIRIGNIKDELAKTLPPGNLRAKVYQIGHHHAHLASSFFVSPFAEAALVSVDGFGDFVSTMVAEGKTNKIRILSEVNYPHSLGIFYTAFTQFLGFEKYGDEYKVMGLSAFGNPSTYSKKMEKVINLEPAGRFRLNLNYFRHHRGGDSMTWDNTRPVLGRAYSEKLVEEFGPPRVPSRKITPRHADIAASVQATYEKVLFHILNHVHKETGSFRLCLSGGCGLNSLANGKIFDRTPFKEIYIQPAANDAGGAIGSAFYLYHHIMGNRRSFTMDTAFWGPEFSGEYIHELLAKSDFGLRDCAVRKTADFHELSRRVAGYLAEGSIVGWFQGRMEWGPRALGNRSILVDPRKKDAGEILNKIVKRRESFRPFAPSILEEYTGEYFEKAHPDPFMLKVYPVRKDKRDDIPAVTHVDGTGRLQTVNKKENPLYWELIEEFRKLTGVPVLLNTSFNENEPIVCRPEEALDCFLRTGMNVLVLGNFILLRPPSIRSFADSGRDFAKKGKETQGFIIKEGNGGS